MDKIFAGGLMHLGIKKPFGYGAGLDLIYTILIQSVLLIASKTARPTMSPVANSLFSHLERHDSLNVEFKATQEIVINAGITVDNRIYLKLKAVLHRLYWKAAFIVGAACVRCTSRFRIDPNCEVHRAWIKIYLLFATSYEMIGGKFPSRF